MIKILLFLTPSIVWAGFNELPSGTQYRYKEEKKLVLPAISKKRVRRVKKQKVDGLLSDLLSHERNIEALLKGREKNLIIRRKDDRIRALTRIKGIVLNSILAMNVRPTTFIVKIQGDDTDLGEAELRCLGVSFQKRVPAKCDLLVTEDQEFKVDVQVWDLDGAEGIIADYFYSGEEKSFLTSSFTSFFEGVLDVAKDRIVTPFGETTKNNGKNKILGGLTGIASNANKLIKKSGEKNLSIAYVNAGKEVLVFFNQSLILTKGER